MAEAPAGTGRSWGARLAGFVPGLVLAAVPAWLPAPAGLACWLVAQPLFAAAAVRALELELEPGFAAQAWRRGLPALLVQLLVAALVLAAAGYPAWRLAETMDLPWVLGTSAGLALAWLLAWRAWPAPALPMLDADGPVARPWPLAPAARGMRLARALLREGEPALARGLLAAAALVVPVALAAALFGFAARLPPTLAQGAWLAQSLLAALGWVMVIELSARALVVEADPEASLDAGPQASVAEALAPVWDPGRALYAAARAGRVDDALAAIEAGAPIDALPPADARDQRTLPMLAAVLADLRLLRELIRGGADLNRRHGELTALLAATRDSYAGRPEAVTMLLANGADPAAVDAEGNTPLHHAARSSDPGVAAQLLDAGAAVDAVNRAGRTPLAEAAASGNWRLAKFLLERGARTRAEGAHPVLLAAAAGEDDAAGVRLLLRHKARVDDRGACGRTALHDACLAGNREIVQALLEAGAEVDARDDQGVSPLLEAARAGANPVIAQLARRKPDPAVVDAAGRSALVLACRSLKADAETIRLLLAAGVDPALADRDGRDALDHAVAGARWPLVTVLDPSYPLPASVCADEAVLAELPPLERLRQALAAHRFDLAAALLAGDGLGAEEREQVFCALATEDQAEALRWLAARLDPERRDGDGEPLLGRVLDLGGEAAHALQALLDTGAPAAGGAGLARFLEACLATDATRRGHEALALALLERGADPFAPARRGEPPLLLALRLGWMRLLESLLARGIDPNLRDARGNTALHAACSMGLEPAVRLLVRHGASPAARAPDGQTPQGLALAAGRRDLARWLNWTGWLPPGRALRDADLVAAAAKGDQPAVERLVALGLSLEAVDAQGCTALLRASGGGHRALAAWLLGHGANPSHAAATGATCLSAATSMGHADVVTTLLEHGAAVDQRLPGGVTPLMVAAALGLPRVVEVLLAHGAAPDARDEQGNTALQAAAQFAFGGRERERALEGFRLLLAAGADADAGNAAGQTPLLLLLGARADPGARCDEDAILVLLDELLARGVELAVQDRRGFGPLHLAALHGLGRAVPRLLQAGADAQLRDQLNRTAHEVALTRGFVDIAQAFGPPRAAPSIARFLRPR